MTVDALRPTVRQMARIASEHAYAWMLADEPDVGTLKEELAEVVAVYAESAAIQAADWYNSADGNPSYSAITDSGLDEDKLANIAEWIHAGPQRPESRIRVAAHKLTFDAARRTVVANAVIEGVAIARHEQAESCNKCIARATTTLRKHNGSSDVVEHFFHPTCEGLFVPVRKGVYVPPDHAQEWSIRIARARRAGNVEPEDIAKWLSTN